MLDYCILLFSLIIIGIWFFKPKILFSKKENNDENNKEYEPKTFTIANVEINMFAVTTLVLAIFTYYVFAVVCYP